MAKKKVLAYSWNHFLECLRNSVFRPKISSAFCNRDVEPAAEVIVRVININYGHNEYLMQGCELMAQYAEFVEITREYALLYDDREEAMNAAIDCLNVKFVELC